MNGVRLEWREAGAGGALVFVHGFPFHSAMWGPQLAALPSGWRGIAPDLRGFGASDAGTDDVTGMDLFARDLEALLDHLDIRFTVLCGLSMGGYIALACWRLFPERIRALVLSDTQAGADSAERKKGREQMARKVEEQGVQPVIDALLPRLVSSTTRYARPGVVELVRAMMLETPPATIARTLRGMALRPDSDPLLRTINVPTLIVVGAEDAITSKGQAEFLARGIRGAHIETIPDAGHIPPLEQPVAFNRVLNAFLGQLPEASKR